MNFYKMGKIFTASCLMISCWLDTDRFTDVQKFCIVATKPKAAKHYIKNVQNVR